MTASKISGHSCHLFRLSRLGGWGSRQLPQCCEVRSPDLEFRELTSRVNSHSGPSLPGSSFSMVTESPGARTRPSATASHLINHAPNTPPPPAPSFLHLPSFLKKLFLKRELNGISRCFSRCGWNGVNRTQRCMEIEREQFPLPKHTVRCRWYSVHSTLFIPSLSQHGSTHSVSNPGSRQASFNLEEGGRVHFSGLVSPSLPPTPPASLRGE